MLKFLILFFLLAGIFLSCDEEPPSPYDFTYPLQSGNSWTYFREMKTVAVDSPATNFTVIRDTLFCTVTQPTTLNDSLNVFPFVSYVLPNPALADLRYYRHTKTGLFIMAYKINKGLLIIPKESTKKRILFKQTAYHSLAELEYRLLHPQPRKAAGDSLYLEDPPVQSLKYPLKVGLQWSYRVAGHPFRIDKRVQSKEIVETEAGSFYCFKIQWLHDMDNNNQWDEETEIIDYVAAQGLIERHITIRDLILTDENGNVIGKADDYDDYTLIDLNVNIGKTVEIP